MNILDEGPYSTLAKIILFPSPERGGSELAYSLTRSLLAFSALSSAFSDEALATHAERFLEILRHLLIRRHGLTSHGFFEHSDSEDNFLCSLFAVLHNRITSRLPLCFSAHRP